MLMTHPPVLNTVPHISLENDYPEVTLTAAVEKYQLFKLTFLNVDCNRLEENKLLEV